MDDSVYADETDVKELLDVSNFDDYDASAGSQKSGASRFNPFNKRPDSSIRHAVNGDVSTHDAAGAPVLQFKEDDDSDDDQLLNLDHTSQGSHRFENPWSSMYPNPNDPDDDDRLLVVIREGFCKGGAGAACDDSCPRHGGNSTIQQEDNDHCHRQRTQSRSKPNDARNRLICASILCLVFVIAEVVGGYFANSLAIMTDAAHMLSDFASFLISLFAIWFAQRPPTKKMSFGYHRAGAGLQHDDDVDYDEVKADLLRLPGVESVHSLCIWVLTMSKNAVAVHIAIRSDVDPLRTLSQATELLRLRHHFVSTTIQVEPYDASIMSTCTHCIGPTK
ncbi:PREDICTED: zinc transporter 2-like [Priapulus caudatus]|uniref:Zinc transporter 2-like n=1 Tax=Priapulus caudatus TaxID=37621 RepID=A0ABM1DYS2_PRICU|nr:PREDICTED: zinc transporter 2-like [Priapulus caudatus]